MTNARLVVALTVPILMAGAVVGAPSCGLISSDITSVKFNLPPRSYDFSTTQAGLNLPAAELPSVPCSATADCCGLVSLVVPGIDCSPIICDAPSGTCALTATIESPPQTVDLKSQAPELQGYSNQTVLDVTISQISYTIPLNTLNVDLPPIQLFVAPSGTTSASDPAAKKFGTVPAIAAGSTAPGKVTLDPAGQDAFVGFAHNFGTPFVFLASTTVVAAGGTPVPMGTMRVTITGQLTAKPSF